MSRLAAIPQPKPAQPVRRGPQGECHGKYPGCDLEDWAEVERLRQPPSNWNEAQKVVDAAFKVSEPIPNDKFRYHWKRRCFCWPTEMRQA